MTLTAIDIFAGGGGLTVGLQRAGFNVVAAVEIEQHAYATYKANHPEVRCFRQDIQTVTGADLLDAAGVEQIDLLAGCPPCQGFTSLTAKYRREDPRNDLIFEMSRLAEEIRPRAIMVENVPGLMHKGAAQYTSLKNRLVALGYCLTEDVLQVADFGVPQFRRRLVLLGGRGFEIGLPEPTHSKDSTNGRMAWRTVRDAIGDQGDPIELTAARKRGAVERTDWHIVRTLSPANRKRIRAARAGVTWPAIPESLRPDCHKGDYRGYTNVYGRMSWDGPAPTITAGCTTFSKGRFGHPEADRTISVREAALLQTFPTDYRFDVPYMEYVCNIIGNALPCDFAAAVSAHCFRCLSTPNYQENAHD